MAQYKNYTLKKYLDSLSEKAPVPGGGSASALCAALGAGLLSMVVNYSLGKGASKKIEKRLLRILKEMERIKKRLLDLVDLDAEAYLEVVKARRGTQREKLKAQSRARAIPLEVARLCFGAVQAAPIIVKNGNKYLLSDVEVALELLLASFNAAQVLAR